MTDTVSCPNCGTALPGDAAFCTNCGSKVEAAGTSATGASTSEMSSSVGDDATRIETPGLHDATRVLPEAPLAQPPESQEPTQFEAGRVPPPWTPPAPPPQAPWQPPPAAGPEPGAWQPPPPPQPQPGWAQPAPANNQGWAAPSTPSAPPSQWQQPAPSAWPAGSASPAATAAEPRSSAGLAAGLAFVGAVLLVVGVFGLWLQSANGSAVKLTGWEMVTKKDEAGPLKSPDPAILLGIAAASIAVGGLMIAAKNRVLMRVLLALAGIGAVVVLVRDYLSIKDAVKHTFDSGTTIDFKYGFWVGAVGAVILLIAAVVPSKKQT